VVDRSKNQELFFEHLDGEKYQKDFLFEGSSNYAFNLILKNKDDELMGRLVTALDGNSIEYRRGSAGGGNQVRQPYIKNLNLDLNPKDFLNTEHIHFYGMYIGNFPSLRSDEIKEICSVINSA
jgi:CDP-4-dehydro-6-deoxyglucose reductase, E1